MNTATLAVAGSRRAVTRRALLWLAFLGPFFFVTYGIANWLAAHRLDVPSITFGWEHAIPFWPWTIFPYWSIDLLYAISLFICSTRRELDTHALRLLTAQVVAIACFVVAPLRFSFDRPTTDSLWGAMFDALAGFDQPFNQLPSLHIALAVILWALYARKLRGIARVAMDLWWLLICASVLTTYQHHFIDIPGGMLLGALCLWFWPFDHRGARSMVSDWNFTQDPVRRRLAILYAIAATLLTTIALTSGGVALWLLWPAVSLLLVSLAYAALGTAAFHKSSDGRMAVAARWLFAPYVAGAWLNSRAWTWRAARPVVIADGVYLGRAPSARELADAAFGAVVDVTAELQITGRGRVMVCVPMLDLVRPPGAALLEAAHAIERLRVAHGSVLVCCALGCSRSVCAVAAWLLVSGRARDLDAALDTMRRARKAVVLESRHVAALSALISPQHAS